MNRYHRRGRLALAAYLLLVIAGALAGFTLLTSTSRYVGSARALAGFEATATTLRLIEDGVPRAELEVHLSNPSPIAISVESFMVTLTVDGQSVGSTQDDPPAGVAPADAAIYQTQAYIGRAIGPASPWEGGVVIYLDPVVMQALRSHEGDAAWRAEIGVFITLPFSHANDYLARSVDLQEVKP